MNTHGQRGRTLRRPRLEEVRKLAALIGLLFIVGTEAGPVRVPRGVFATVGVLALMIASVLALIERRTVGRNSCVYGYSAPAPQSTRAWRWTLIGLACTGAVVAQTWFPGGTAIAGGDITPPVGTAWIGRLFSPFVWSGDNLGGPGQAQGQLPWAAVDWLVHLIGGSGALAQRIWLSALIAGILVAGAALVRGLGFGPLAGIAAALLYFFNPHTISDVGVNDVYLVSMALLAALPALVLAYSRCRIRMWVGLAGFIVSAPFVGFAFANPPLVGMIAITTMGTPLLAWLRFGRPAAHQALRLVLIGGALLLATSAYWIVPDTVALGGVATGNLSSLSAWAFTEQRSTLANALWLNTSWGWRYSVYFPYARDFARFPLGIIQVLLPLLAFSGLALRSALGEVGSRLTRMRGFIGIVTLLVIILSTGTRPPGNVLFDPLYYHLPYGWLLREPGRFLMLAALGYAVLAASLVEYWSHNVPERRWSLPGWPKPVRSTLLPALLALSAVVALGLASGFPLWTGAVVPGARQAFPSTHVTVPTDWLATAHYLNTDAPSGSLLILPPDDFYQMPYSWYYGNDGFIANLVDRHVLVPSAQGYSIVSTTLLASVHLEASALLAHAWTEASRLLQALGTPLVLVRGDIASNFYDRDIASPAALAASLAQDPNMRILYADGSLKVYGPRARYPPTTGFATVNTPTPDLRVLAALPSRTALVTASPIPGHLAIRQLPPVATWHLGKTALTTSVPEPKGWQYSALALGLPTYSAPNQIGLAEHQVGVPGGSQTLQLRLPVGQSLIGDGSFTAGPWDAVGNCNNSVPVVAPNFLRATVLPHSGPGGTPALQVAASIDAACEATELKWHSGPVLVNIWVRTRSGAPPRMCFWETPIDRCAPTAALPSSSQWRLYRTTVVPATGTETVTLFVYAFAQSPGHVSVDQYAGVVARSILHRPTIDVVGRPTTDAAPTRLLSYPTGYAPGWIGPRDAVHVLVDGLRNGWLTTSNSRAVRKPTYLPSANEGRDELLLASTMLLVAAASTVISRRRYQSAPSAR